MMSKPERMATLIRNAALTMLRDAQEYYTDDAEMQCAAQQDAEDLYTIAKRLSDGKILEAYSAAGHLDTYVRDIIPDEAWNFMTRYATLME